MNAKTQRPDPTAPLHRRRRPDIAIFRRRRQGTIHQHVKKKSARGDRQYLAWGQTQPKTHRFRQKIEKCDGDNRSGAERIHELRAVAKPQGEIAADERRPRCSQRGRNDGDIDTSHCAAILALTSWTIRSVGGIHSPDMHCRNRL